MIQIVLDKRMKDSEHSQIIDQLKMFHVQSTLDDGALFPDYQAVAVANHISETVLKKAYDQLVKDGYLNVDKGRYTVRRISIPRPKRFYDVFADFEKIGMQPSFETLSVEIKNHLPAVFKVDGTLRNLRYVKTTRIFYANDIPIVYVEAYYDIRDFQDFAHFDFNKERIFPYLEKTHGKTFSHYHQLIDVVQPSIDINKALNQPANASVFRMKFEIYDQTYQPMEFAIFHASILYALESAITVKDINFHS